MQTKHGVSLIAKRFSDAFASNSFSLNLNMTG